MATGHYSLDDLKVITNQTVIQFDEDRVTQIIQNDLAAYNRTLAIATADLMVTTTERVATYGAGSGRSRPKKIDEYGRVPTQRTRRTGATFGLPLEKWGDALGWTRDVLQEMPVSQVAEAVADIQANNTAEMYAQILAALFVPTNYTFYDYHVDDAELLVKRLVNADGAAIPNSGSSTFDAATHSHYLADATLTAAGIDEAIATVREHGLTGRLVVYINATNQAAVEALAEFTPPVAPFLRPGANETVATIAADLGGDDDNRVIGVWRGRYLVSTKPWVPANYLFVYDVTNERPLAMRVPVAPSLQGLRLVAQLDPYPLRADYWEHRFGIGVQNRLNGCVLQFNNATYSSPSV